MFTALETRVSYLKKYLYASSTIALLDSLDLIIGPGAVKFRCRPRTDHCTRMGKNRAARSA
jgi:hypothetical protein